MKFTIETKSISDALNVAAGYALKASSLSITSMAYIDAKDGLLTVRAGSNSSNFECSLPAEIAEEGQLLVSTEKFAGILSKITADSVICTRDGSTMLVKPASGKKTSVKLPCRDVKDYPAANVCADDLYVAVPGAAIADAMARVAFAAAKDTARVFLNGIRFEQETTDDGKAVLTLVATDGRLLATERVALDTPIPGFTGGTIPVTFVGKMMNALKSGNAFLAFDNNMVFIKNGIIKLNNSLVVSGNYPAWQRVIPDLSGDKLEIKLAGADLDETLGLTSVLVDAASRKTNLTFSATSVTVTSFETQFGEAEQEFDLISSSLAEGETLSQNFNEQLLKQVIATVKTSNLTLSMRKAANGYTGPLVVSAESFPTLMYCVMPMQR